MIAETLIAACLLLAEPGWKTACVTQVSKPPKRVVQLAPHYHHRGGNTEQWRTLVAAYFGEHTDRALCLMGYESGGNPNAVNPTSGAAGLFQVMPFWWDHYGGDRFDPETNVRVAYQIYLAQGWWAWSPYKRGLCRDGIPTG